MSKIFAYIPSAYKVGKTYTAIPNDGNADFDFSRSTTADRTDENGNIESMAINVPRIDYANGGCPELLLDTGESCNNAQAIFNDIEGVFQVEIRALSDDGTDRSICLNNGGANDRIETRYSSSSNQISSYFLLGGASNSMTYEVGDVTNKHFVETIYNGDYAELKIDGVRVGFRDDRKQPTGLDRCSFSIDGASGLQFKGRCKSINVYDSSTDVKTFTSPTELMTFAGYEIIN